MRRKQVPRRANKLDRQRRRIENNFALYSSFMKSYVSHAFIGNSPRVYRPKCPHCKPATYAIPFKWRIIDPYNVTVACVPLCAAPSCPTFDSTMLRPLLETENNFAVLIIETYALVTYIYIYIYAYCVAVSTRRHLIIVSPESL